MNARLMEKEGFAGLLLRLRGEGITDKMLLTAMEQTPRTLFLSAAHAHAAYSDRLLPIDCGGFAEGGDLVARLLSLADIKPGQRVLDVGTGSGFLGAVAGRMAERVLTIDRYRTLTQLAQQRFQHLGLSNVIARHADGNKAVSGEGMFDRIIVTASFDAMPRHYVDCLAAGGIMLAPIIGADGITRLCRLLKIGSRFEREDLFPVPYSRMIPGLAAAL
ncbi:protein-L-isoaspartate(D-aspartate) O-methyltransferase [Hoeflea marina]|uniref:protein-L-isoaspartate(D-aspartate) O-methyltransferase n=1 Tax=Hoeflea marina TaxID=274592 RepID=UPI000D71D36D|nr:protein-L-isoaspartate(D-aspartate) O-methyltransferase [Hoeflea marina]